MGLGVTIPEYSAKKVKRADRARVRGKEAVLLCDSEAIRTVFKWLVFRTGEGVTRGPV